jgi:hypothetical protein
LVNKFDAELPIGTRNGISQNYNRLFINDFCSLKILTRKTPFSREEKTQVLYYQALAFLDISKIRELFTF